MPALGQVLFQHPTGGGVVNQTLPSGLTIRETKHDNVYQLTISVMKKVKEGDVMEGS